jgi:hypothetical protein
MCKRPNSRAYTVYQIIHGPARFVCTVVQMRKGRNRRARTVYQMIHECGKSEYAVCQMNNDLENLHAPFINFKMVLENWRTWVAGLIMVWDNRRASLFK